MRSNWNLSFVVVTMTLLQLCLGSQSEAQELRKAIRDYRDDRVFNYQPNDPWYRGKLFNVQTKHYGRYYNCDGEEAKRNSPYICWKPHYEKDFPTRYRASDIIRYDYDIIRRRLNEGSCKENSTCQNCQDSAAPNSTCNCVECQGAVQPQPVEYEYLSESTTERRTSGDRTPSHEVFTASNSPVIVDRAKPRQKISRHSRNLPANVAQHSTQEAKPELPKYGLIAGKIVRPLSRATTQNHLASGSARTAASNPQATRTANAAHAPTHRRSAPEATTANATLSSSSYFNSLKRR